MFEFVSIGDLKEGEQFLIARHTICGIAELTHEESWPGFCGIKLLSETKSVSITKNVMVIKLAPILAESNLKDQALKERDELAAELERVKAERDELKANSFSDDLKTMSILAETDQHIKDCKTFLEEFKKLSSLKSRLPVNADGDVPDIGDKQWYWYDYPGSSPEELEIECIRDNGGGWEFGFTNGAWHFSSYCHSTAESCRAAHEGKEGENDAN